MTPNGRVGDPEKHGYLLRSDTVDQHRKHSLLRSAQAELVGKAQDGIWSFTWRLRLHSPCASFARECHDRRDGELAKPRQCSARRIDAF
jgi:hypothetical protein